MVDKRVSGTRSRGVDKLGEEFAKLLQKWGARVIDADTGKDIDIEKQDEKLLEKERQNDDDY